MSGGTLDDTGNTILTDGAQMNLTGTTYAMAIDGGPIDSSAAGASVDWTGGYLSGTLNVQGTFDISGGGAKSLDATINLSGPGASTWSGNWVSLWATARSSTTWPALRFTLENNASWGDSGVGGGTVGVFNNAGTLIESGVTGSSTFVAPFNNSGTVDVESGMLILGSGGTIDAGATFTGSGFTQLGWTFVGENGHPYENGGAMAVNGPASATNLSMIAGTLTGAGDLTITGEFDISGGVSSTTPATPSSPPGPR